MNASEFICTDYNPLEGVVLHDKPCPPGSDPDQAWRDTCELNGWESPISDDEEALLRMLGNAIQFADSRIAEVGALGGNKNWWEGKAEATELCHLGWSFDELADWLGVEPSRIARLFCKEADRVETILGIDRLVRSADWDETIDSVISQSGLPRATVQQLLVRLGVQVRTVKNKRGGGGWKYTPEQYEAIRVMRQDHGWSYGVIGKHMAMDPSTVFRICDRKGWR